MGISRMPHDIACKILDPDPLIKPTTGSTPLICVAGAAGEEIRARTLGALICEATTIPEMTQHVFIQVP